MQRLEIRHGDIRIGWSADGIDIYPLNHPSVHIPAYDLYFNAPSRRDPVSGQRLGSTLDDPAEVRICDITPDGNGIAILFDTNERLSLSPESAAGLVAVTDPCPEPGVWPVLWNRALAESFPTFDYRDYLLKPGHQHQALVNLVRYGFVRLTGAPLQYGEIEQTIATFGQLRETNYGRIFDVRTKPDPENLAYSDRGLEVHTDNPYRDPVPGLQVLHCLGNADEGGETCLVDGFMVAAQLKASHADAFDCLTMTPCHFHWRDDKTRLEAIAPILSLDREGAVNTIRFNHRSLGDVVTEPQNKPRWRAAYRAFAQALNSPDLTCQFRLNPGDVLIMDNHRILHGRSAFDGAKNGARQGRWLQGAYAEKDGLRSRLRVLDQT
jgi:gamma-butyrobetaine dioxygenase